MFDGIDIWGLFAGLGLFLFGIRLLERALANLAGRRFKRFLRQHTDHPTQSILAGTLATMLLQSSSLVGLTVLAFVGAGIIELTSALGIIFGANFGTTFTGWLVTTLGFKLEFDTLSLPAIAIGTLGMVLIPERKAGFNLSKVIAGFGFLFMGLGYMKGGAVSAADLLQFDPAAGYSLLVYLLLAALVTAIIQSSSATMVITLSALNAGMLELPAAAAVAIGADLGTTVTVMLGAIGAGAAKKRVAVGHFLFNLITDVVAFLLLFPLLFLIQKVLGVGDPLFALVAFHSLFNFMGVLLFYPLIRPFSRFLNRRFAGADRLAERYISRTSAAVSEAAVEGLRLETRRLIDQAAALNLKAFDLSARYSYYDSAADRADVEVFDTDADYDRSYQTLKQLEGAILSFALRVQNEPLEDTESAQLGQVLRAIRSAVHSAKCLKDVHEDMHTFRESESDFFNAYYGRFRAHLDTFYKAVNGLRKVNLESLGFEPLAELVARNSALHDDMHRDIYQEATLGDLDAVQISTLLNVNREVFSSNQSLILAISDASLTPEKAEDLASLKGAA